MTELQGRQLANPIAPGSPEWWTRMSASKVAAAMGLSPWESPFSLWHKMAGTLDSPPMTPEQARGHYLEPAIHVWFTDQHPDWRIEKTGTWQHNQRPWQISSPDAAIWIPTSNGWEMRTGQWKTDAHPDGGPDPEWGEEGTDQIPAGYRVQVMWEMDTLGVPTAHVACLSAYLQFKEYVVHYDPDEAATIRDAVTKFMDTLPGGPNERRPDIDAHTATYQAIRELNPHIVDESVELDPDTAEQYLAAIDAEKYAKAAKSRASALVIDEIGDAKYATYLGTKIARREQRGDNTPYLKQTGHRPHAQEAKAA